MSDDTGQDQREDQQTVTEDRQAVAGGDTRAPEPEQPETPEGESAERQGEPEKGRGRGGHNRDKAIQKVQQRQARLEKQLGEIGQGMKDLTETLKQQRSEGGPSRDEQRQTERETDRLQDRLDALKDADIVENPDAYKQALGEIGREIASLRTASRDGGSGLEKRLDELGRTVKDLKDQQQRQTEAQQQRERTNRWWRRFEKQHPDLDKGRVDELLAEAREYVEDELDLTDGDPGFVDALREEFVANARVEQRDAERARKKSGSDRKQPAKAETEAGPGKGKGSTQQAPAGTETVPQGASAGRRATRSTGKREKPPSYVPDEEAADYKAAGYDVRG